jgi:hypothetical protein
MNDASAELARLIAVQHDLAERVDAITADERTAHAGARAASEALVELERAGANGEKITAARRAAAEDELLKAKSAALAPWPERREAARRAAGDAQREVALFARDNLADLLADLNAEAKATAAEMDRAAAAVVAAHEARASVEARMFSVLRLIGPTTPADVQRGRSEALVHEAQRLIGLGGELPPVAAHASAAEPVTV